MSNTDFYSLKIASIKQETDDTVSLSFSVPENIASLFSYKAGQYLTLKFNVKGESVRRAYSMSSSPISKNITVTVKRVKGGLVSNYINDQLKVGDAVDVMPPQGKFLLNPEPESQRDIYLFGAGSGITPLMSILRTILEEETMSTVYLFYGNRDENHIIFKEELDHLVKSHQGQLYVDYILSQPVKTKPSGLSGFFKKATTSWKGLTGRIGAQETVSFLNRHTARSKNARYFICGPNQMMDTVEEQLTSQGVDPANIEMERFTTDDLAKNTPPTTTTKATVKAVLDGEEVVFEVSAGKTILDAMLDKKLEPPYSCLSGACSTCVGKLEKGQVKMDACYGLDEDEVEEGYVLTCQARPVSSEIEINLDV